MPEEHRISFTTEKTTRYRPGFDTVNCEKVCLADVDGDGRLEMVIPRCGSSGDKSTGEIAVYDLDLKLKARDTWDGTAMDVAAVDIDGDGTEEIIVAGGIRNSSPIIRTYKYNEDYKGNLELSSQIGWKSPEGLFSTAKAIHIADRDGQMEMAVLTIVEGSRGDAGYVQLRLYDADMQLKNIAKWTPMGGSIVKYGHCMTAVDLDGDGREELVTLINFRHQSKQKSDLRVFDHHLVLKQRCETIADESLFATCMAAGDIDADGEAEIVIAGGAFPKVWQGATNQLIVFDNTLNIKSRTMWKTFRHSWVWGLQIDDVDGDGDQQIVTYGGTSMRGRNQGDANVMGEIRVWGGVDLSTRDIFIWQSKPGEDTRPSRGFAWKDEGQTRFVTATSIWSGRNKAPELEIRILSYKPAVGAMERYSDLIRAYDERDVESLTVFAGDAPFAPLALEALAICGEKAVKAIGGLLVTQDKPLFLRTVQLLRGMGDKAIGELRRIGFTHPDDWIIASPFDNADNAGFDTQYPPEAESDLNAFFAGRDKIVRWGEIEYYKNDAYVDLAYAHFESFERTGIEFFWNVRHTRSVAYALTDIQVPASMEAELRIGNVDGVKLWFDNELKYSSTANREASPDQGVVSVSLKEGKNRILLKIANQGTDSWGFYFRVTDSEGKPIPDLRYQRPEVSHIHNQMLSCAQLISLLNAEDERLRCFAASQLASSGDRRGNETLAGLLESEDDAVRAKAALSLTMAGDSRGADPLVRFAPGQNYLFQLSAGYALKRAGDARAEQFSTDSLKDNAGKKIVELKVTNKNNGFRVVPFLRGDETAHVEVSTDKRFHLGDNISAGYASIASFGIREPRFRGAGLGGIAIKRACDLMVEQGYSCSTVSTGTRLVAHRLYCRSGYVDRRFPWEYGKHLVKEDAAQEEGQIKVRDYSDADRAEVSRLREQYISSTIGPVDWSPRSSFGPGIRVIEDDGKVIGYADVYLNPFESLANINLLHIDREHQDEPLAVKELISGIHRYALEASKERIGFRDPPMNYRDVLLKMGYSIEPECIRYGWVNMFKIIDLTRFLREIAELLSLRLQRSPHAGWCGSVSIEGSKLMTTFAIDNDGKVNVEDNFAENADLLITADDTVVNRLVSGNEDVWESYRQHTFTVSPIFNERIRGLIESLFPIMPHKQGGWW